MASIVHWPAELVLEALALFEAGLTTDEVEVLTGIPAGTLRNYRAGRLPRRVRRATSLSEEPDCLDGLPDIQPEQYAYVLGVYLGDGTVLRHGRNKTSFALRIVLDTAYPWIVISVADAIEDLIGRRPHIAADSRGANCVHVYSYAKEWGYLLPQRGAGRKHDREIALAAWQQEIVEQAPQAFLRGLIHSDGWRGINKVISKGREYSYPRYQFSNRSDDIRGLFTSTCECLGVQWRRWGRWNISVARADSVRLLDSFIGPKC